MQFVIQLFFSLTLLTLIINLVLGYVLLSHPQFFIAHLVLGLGSTFLGVLVAQMSMSYFLGTRDLLMEQDRLSKIPPQTLEEAKLIKKKLFAACGPAMILILLHAVLGGCVYIQIVPPLPHHVLAYLVLMAFAQAFRSTVAFHRFRPKLLEGSS